VRFPASSAGAFMYKSKRAKRLFLTNMGPWKNWSISRSRTIHDLTNICKFTAFVRRIDCCYSNYALPRSEQVVVF